MHKLVALPYAIAGRAARLAVTLTPPGSSKLRRALAGRRGVVRRIERWADENRDPERKLLWIHAPSVGEGLQAAPVLEWFREHQPEVQLVYTHYSPSAESFARGLNVDFADYMPLDVAGDVRRVIRALEPSALVFSKLDVWPVLCREAKKAGVKLGMISATLADDSTRRGRLARALLTDAYGAMSLVGAVSDEDAQRLVALGVPFEALRLTGDTRYDQVWTRAQEVDRSKPPLSTLASSRPTVVAGSTWPADERALTRAWSQVMRAIPGVRLILAPHEPTPEHLEPLVEWAANSRLSHAPVDTATSETDVVFVNRVGILGDLYALADASVVGGGFHDEGLHSVLEPAAFGSPVIFGPISTNRDARALTMAGGAVAVPGADALANAIIRWLSDCTVRDVDGGKARTVVQRGAGATGRSALLVKMLLGIST